MATDAPLLAHQCSALARRVTTGVGRTGTAGSHFSGDLFLALSTGNPRAFPTNAETLHGEAGDGLRTLRFVPWGALDPYFAAVVQATEEAILNALVANAEMTGLDGHRTPALPRIASPRCCATRYPENTLSTYDSLPPPREAMHATRGSAAA